MTVKTRHYVGCLVCGKAAKIRYKGDIEGSSCGGTAEPTALMKALIASGEFDTQILEADRPFRAEAFRLGWRSIQNYRPQAAGKASACHQSPDVPHILNMLGGSYSGRPFERSSLSGGTPAPPTTGIG